MEFSLSEEQRAIVELATSLLGDYVGDDVGSQPGSVEEQPYHVDCWEQFSALGLTGIAVPVAYGGSGLTYVELCLVIEQLGRSLVSSPFVGSIALAGMAISRFGSVEQQSHYLPALVRGELIMSAALTECGIAGSFTSPCDAEPKSAGWLLSGKKLAVPFAAQAQCVLVPVLDTKTAKQLVLLVNPLLPGITLTAVNSTHAEPQYHMEFDRVEILEADCLGGDDDEVSHYLELLASTAYAFLNLGIAEEALRRTAEYTSERQQFGRAIGSFQAVAMRAADACIDVEAIRVSCWQAAWRLSQGKSSEAAVRVAKWWASEAANRVVHSAQHLHGGVGADRSYPIHRYFLSAKNNELAMGAGSHQLAHLGQVIMRDKLREAEV